MCQKVHISVEILLCSKAFNKQHFKNYKSFLTNYFKIRQFFFNKRDSVKQKYLRQVFLFFFQNNFELRMIN